MPDAGLRVRSGPGRFVIVATVLGSGIAAIDATAVGIALPSIGRDFHVGLASLQWIVTAYTLTLAGLLLVGGSLGDRYGRRKIFVIGVTGFALASLLCGIAPNVTALIAARALQGVAGALLVPGSLAILQASFAAEDRSRAIGAWSGLGGVATAIGPFLGGWLIEAVSWRLVFFINLPLAALVVALSMLHVPESVDPDVSGKVDITGGLLVTLGLVGVVYGLIEGPGAGWTSPRVAVFLIAGVVLLAAFVGVERRSTHPMLRLDLFRSLQFTSANVITFIVYAALGGALFLLPIELQQVGGYSVVASGTALLPLTILMLLGSSRSGALAARIGPRLQMTVGPIVAGIGLAMLVGAGGSGGYVVDVLPGAIVLGLGLTTNVAPLTSTVLAAAPAEHAGVASAVNNDVARTAGLVAVAVLPALAGISGADYLDAGAFNDGFRTAMVISAVLCVLGGLLAAATIRNPAPVPVPTPEEVPARAERPCLHCALDATPLQGPQPEPARAEPGAEAPR